MRKDLFRKLIQCYHVRILFINSMQQLLLTALIMRMVRPHPIPIPGMINKSNTVPTVIKYVKNPIIITLLMILSIWNTL